MTVLVVGCDGKVGAEHSRIEFQLQTNSLASVSIAVATWRACPVCLLMASVDKLTETVEEVWDKYRSTKGMLDEFEEMRDWWVATCKLDAALAKDEPDGGMGAIDPITLTGRAR